jgi:hypothetical protein
MWNARRDKPDLIDIRGVRRGIRRWFKHFAGL